LAPALAGLGFLLLYAGVAWANGFFAFTDFDYLRDKAVILFSFRHPQLASMFWKLALVLPATGLFTVALVRSGIRLRLPRPDRDWKVLLPVMTGATVLIALSITLLFRQTEVTDDENTYLFQARTLLLGRVANPPPPVQKSFDNVFLINDGRVWAGKYGVGHPAVVALGLLAGSRYAGTVALSVLTILLIYLIVRTLDGDRPTALLAACLTAASPFFYFVSSTLLSHTTGCFLLSLFFLLVLKSRQEPAGVRKPLLALAAGLVLGVAFNVRPLTAIGYGVPFGLLLGMDALRRKPGSRQIVATAAAGFLAVAAATLWYNREITGSAFTLPFSYYNAEEAIGFGVYGHTPMMALNNLAVSAARMNAFLFGFPLSLMFAAVPFAFKTTEGDRLAAGIVGSLAVAYMFYWTAGVSDAGPVYYFEMLAPLVVLSARGAVLLHRAISRWSPDRAGTIPALLAISVATALLTFVPERAVHLKRLTDRIREPYEALESAAPGHAVVLVRSLPNKGWVFGYRHPSPALDENAILCAFEDKTSNLAVADAFPDRQTYVMWYDPRWERTVVRRVTREELMTLPGGGER
jgi:hypothetical protein